MIEQKQGLNVASRPFVTLTRVRGDSRETFKNINLTGMDRIFRIEEKVQKTSLGF